MNQLACAALAGCAFLVGVQGAEARTHHGVRYAQHSHAHRSSWPLTTHYPEWPKSSFFGPRWTGDNQPWYKSDGSAGYGAQSEDRYAPLPFRRMHLARAQSFTERHVAMSSGLGPRPRAWCGWFMRQVKGVADSAYNLAWNWAHWGHSSGPVVGAVAVWHHHVGEVAAGECPAGRIMLHSGNDGNAVRTRCVPIRGAIFREA